MSNKDKKHLNITNKERAEFRDAMYDVKPLKTTDTTESIHLETKDTVESEVQRTFTIKPFRMRKQIPINTIAPARMHHDTVSGNDSISYHQSGIQHKLRNQLRQGKLAIEATLDLHLHNADQAIAATAQFISDSQYQGYRMVCLIHGKGRGSTQAPVIKNILNTYLRHHDGVLAFHSAKPKDGGTGALYVLLKKQT